MDIYPRNFSLSTDSAGRQLVQHFAQNQNALGLDGAVAFCEFPLFREDEDLLRSKLLIVSPNHGVVIFGSFAGGGADGLLDAVEQTDGIFNHVYSKLLKSTRLRQGRGLLRIPVDAAVFAPEVPARKDDGATKTLSSIAAANEFLASTKQNVPLPPDLISEIISVVEGSKGLVRPKTRPSVTTNTESKAALVGALDDEIRRFDRDQRLGYMTEVYGPQRITGLAGSGKTVILAMKAALAHLRDRNARIAFVFYTKSLYQHVKQLITRFYRQFDDRDPDWDRLRVLHAWGGQINDGFYYYVAKVSGVRPLTYGQAKSLNPRRPFQFACDQLLETAALPRLFDYIFVDEAQDFPPSFLRVALQVAEEERLVIAYDVFQTIFDVEIPSSEVLFGTNELGEPAVTFEEDIPLRKCYRNPLEVLVCAHAIGFGIYASKIVQMLGSEEHWEDFGYELKSGALTSGQAVTISRPVENSPSSISRAQNSEAIIRVEAFDKPSDEVSFVVTEVMRDIQEQGLQPEDILVICADDLNARRYFKALTNAFAERDIPTHDLQEDSYSLKNFSEKGHVTLSTVYKAKGNEAFEVFVLGIDSVFGNPSAKYRNIAFTAMTRTKGWLRVSGTGPAAKKFKAECDTAITNLPELKFTFPSPEQLISIKRDLMVDATENAALKLDELEHELSADEYETALVRKLQEIRKKKGRGRNVTARKLV